MRLPRVWVAVMALGVLPLGPPAARAERKVTLGAHIAYDAHDLGGSCDVVAFIRFPIVHGVGGREPPGITYTVTWDDNGGATSKTGPPFDDHYTAFDNTLYAAPRGEHQFVLSGLSGGADCAALESQFTNPGGTGKPRFSKPQAVATLPGLFLLAGTITRSQQPAAGVKVKVTGSESTGRAVDATTVTGSSGSYAFALLRGRYTVAPVGTTAQPKSVPVSLDADRRGVDFSIGTAGLRFTMTLDPSSVAGDGYGTTRLRVRLTDQDGNPIAAKFAVAIKAPHASDTPLPSLLACDGGLGEGGVFDRGPGLPQTSQIVLDTDSNGEGSATLYVGMEDPVGGAIELSGLGGIDSNGQVLTSNTVIQRLSLEPFRTANIPTVSKLDTLAQVTNAPHVDIDGAPLQSQVVMMEWLNELRSAGDIPAQALIPEQGVGTGLGLIQGPPLIGFDSYTPESGFGILDLPVLQQLNQPPILPTPPQWVSQHQLLTDVFGWYGDATSGSSDQLVFGQTGIYPPPIGSPDRAAFDQCSAQNHARPASHQFVTWKVFSPARLLFRDAKGRLLGYDDHGHAIRGFPGLISPRGSEPQIYAVPADDYQITVTATGNGSVTIAADSAGPHPHTVTFDVRVKKGQQTTLTERGRSLPATLRIGGRTYHATSGLTLRVAGLPPHLRRRTQISLRITDQLGRSVANALISIVTGPHHPVSILTDTRGRGMLLLKPRDRIRVTAPGYRTLTVELH